MISTVLINNWSPGHHSTREEQHQSHNLLLWPQLQDEIW